MGFSVEEPPPPPAAPTTFTGTEYTESLAFDTRITSIDGLTFTTATPTKYASNPIIAYVDAPANDQFLSYVSVQKVGSTWHMLYYGSEIGASEAYVNYATSSDGLTWTKPSIGRVTYDGDTDNNIVLEGVFTSGRWVPEISKWVVTVEGTTAAGGLEIYTSDDADGPYTLVAFLDAPGYEEGKEVVLRPDGRWVGYYVSGHGTDLRELSAWVSDDTGLTGSWSRYNSVIPTSASSSQKYSIGAEVLGDTFVGFVLNYDSTDGLGTIVVDLYRSQDALEWELVSSDFVPLGADTAWDDEMIISGNRIAKDGNDWHIYYCGAALGHDSPTSATNRGIGRVTFPAGRLFGYTGTGTIATEVTEVLDDTYTAFDLTVNADATGGSIDIELRDSGGAPISGFAAADFDTITTSVFDLEPTWGGLPAPQNADLRMVFTLTSATLHGYTITRS